MASKVITGRVTIRVNNKVMLTKTGAKAIGIGGNKREPVVGEEYHGHKETPTAARCEFSITDRSDVSLQALHDTVGATLTFESSEEGGKVYIMEDAVCEGGFDVTAGEGETPVAFFGPRWIEQGAEVA